MGGRSEGESDAIAFIHADDAANWATFLQNKLRSDSYKIHSYLHHEPNQNYIPELFSSTQTCVVLVSPFLLEVQHSMFWTRCVERFHHRTVVVFLGVNQDELLLNLGTSLTEHILSHICLEVDGSKESVTTALIRIIEVYEHSDSSVLHSLCEDGAPGEDEDLNTDQGNLNDIYDYPPQPRQQNSIVRVMPSVLYETDSRDVLVLMEREADGKLTMVLDSACGSGHISLKRVASSAYLATLPSDVQGKVNFMVLSQDEQNLGKSSLYVYSRMEQLCCLLQKETSPLTQLCRVMGVSGTRSSETDELDSLLARRLSFSQFPSGLKNILYGEEQSATADQGSSQWPTLLHFVAEFNLTRTCEELLRYPGTIHSACLENCNGFFPSQLAEKNGFTSLQKRLVQYVEDMRLRRSAADSGISFSENLPAPSPHSSHGHMYVNEMPPSLDPPDLCKDSSEDYIDMSAARVPCHGGQRVVLPTCQEGHESIFESDTLQKLPAPSRCLMKVNDGYAKPRSFSEGCVKTPYAKTPSEARIAEEENGPPPLEPKVNRTRSVCNAYVSACQFPSADRRPDSSSSEASDSQQVSQEESSCKSSTETLTHSESEPTSGSDPKSDERVERVSFNLDSTRLEDRPASQASTASSLSDYEVPPGHAGASIDDIPVLRGKSKRSKSVQDKISHFFKKIKSPRRLHSSSESDLPTKGQKKAVVYSRQSTSSTSSDPLGYRSSQLRSKYSESERDSGAVCDDHGSPVMRRKKGKCDDAARNTGKRNGLSMQRRVSVRVQRAKEEDLSETPILPARGPDAESGETFVSFIK